MFNGRDNNVKSFNAVVYELTDVFNIDLDRVILSAPVVCNKNDKRYVIWYKIMDGNIVPLHVKSPITCYSNRGNRQNENSARKVGLDISDDKEWMKIHKAIWKETDHQLNVSLESVARKDAYIKPKFITWGEQFKINFHGTDIPSFW